MHVTHAPKDWKCIFCTLAAGGETTLTKRDAMVWSDDSMTAFVASHWWPANPGHVLIIPNAHVENLYEFPDDLAIDLMRLTRAVAIALKVAFNCDGVSTRQHNEPAGSQDIWHFHQHVFPRWHDDGLYERHQERQVADRAQVAQRAALIRSALSI